MKKILIISSTIDITVDYIISENIKKCKFFRINFDKIFDYKIEVRNNDILISNEYAVIKLSEIDAIYYRKIRMPDIGKYYEPKYQEFVVKELYALVFGIVESFEGRCLSKPSILRKSENKILQLKLAEKIGLQIPESLITNNPAAVKNFNKYKDIIVKPIFTGLVQDKNEKTYVQTNLVTDSYIMDEKDFCPVYYQEYIEKNWDLRITVINGEFFPVKIECADKVDWRKNTKNIKYSIVEIPSKIKEKCLQYLNQLELKFGVFDFMVKGRPAIVTAPVPIVAEVV